MDLTQIRQALAGVAVGTVVYTLQQAGLTRCFMPVPPVTPQSPRFVGVARTLRAEPAREDVLARRRAEPKSHDPHRIAFDELSEGEVLVIAARGEQRAAVLGDLLAQRVATSGGAAVVTDGCVRDLPGVREVGLPVFASGAHAATFPTAHVAVEVNGVVGCGGVLVYPGDVLAGDEEGVAVIPAERVDDIVAASQELERRDAFSLEKIRGGTPLAEAYPLSEALRAEFERRDS